MPMTFTDEIVDRRLRENSLPAGRTPQENREQLAQHVETVYGDHVEAWEIRTGRPWTEMTSAEAQQLVREKPRLMGNPGVLSRLYGTSRTGR